MCVCMCMCMCMCIMHAHMWHACTTHAPRTYQVERLLAEHEVLRQSLIDSKLKHMSAEQELALLRKEQARHAYRVAASITWDRSLYHVESQSLSHGVAASITRGLQPLSHGVQPL